MKRCSACREFKPPAEFHRNRQMKDGLANQCKECKRAVVHRSYWSDPERAREYRRQWSDANREKMRESARDYARRAASEGKITPETRRAAHLKFYYRLTPEGFDALLERQGGVCATCKREEPGAKGWHVDHDHSCCPGKRSCGECVRGVLCFSCNTGLGYLRDDTATLRRAIAYLSGSFGRPRHPRWIRDS